VGGPLIGSINHQLRLGSPSLLGVNWGCIETISRCHRKRYTPQRSMKGIDPSLLLHPKPQPQRHAFVIWDAARPMVGDAWEICVVLGLRCEMAPAVFLPSAGETRCGINVSQEMLSSNNGRSRHDAGLTLAHIDVWTKVINRCVTIHRCEPSLVFEGDAVLPGINGSQAKPLIHTALFENRHVDLIKLGWCKDFCLHAYQISPAGAASLLRMADAVPACAWGISFDDNGRTEMMPVDERTRLACWHGMLQCTSGHDPGSGRNGTIADLPNTHSTRMQGIIKQKAKCDQPPCWTPYTASATRRA